MNSSGGRSTNNNFVMDFEIDSAGLKEIREEINTGSQIGVGTFIASHVERLKETLKTKVTAYSDNTTLSQTLQNEIENSPAFKLISADLLEFVKNVINENVGATFFKVKITAKGDAIEIDLIDDGNNAGLAEKLKEGSSIDYGKVVDDRGRVASLPGAKNLSGEGRGLGEASQYLKTSGHGGSLQLVRDQDSGRVYIKIISAKVVGKDFFDFQKETQISPDNTKRRQDSPSKTAANLLEPASPIATPILQAPAGGLFAKRQAAAAKKAATEAAEKQQLPSTKITPSNNRSQQ